jgi:hypothetical protein
LPALSTRIRFDRNRIMDQEGRTEWDPNPDDRLAKTFGGPTFERISRQREQERRKP